MKLYYSPGACSLAPHIILQEIGVPYTAEKVDLKAHKTDSGKDFYAINAKGYVPALELDNGELLTEGVAMLLHLAALKPEKKLAALPGDKEFLKQLEWLVFISTEFHKGLGATAWMPIDAAAKDVFRNKLTVRFDYLDKHLAKHQYVAGDHFTIADAYLFTVLGWAKQAQIDIAKWSHVAAHYARVGARPAVIAAMEKEGLQAAKAA